MTVQLVKFVGSVLMLNFVVYCIADTSLSTRDCVTGKFDGGRCAKQIHAKPRLIISF